MTSSTMAVPSRGRPRLSGSFLQIRLRSPVFDLWNQRKSTLGFEGAAGSELCRIPSPFTNGGNIVISEVSLHFSRTEVQSHCFSIP